MKTLILGLGNDLMGDDRIGVLVAERLRLEAYDSVDVVTSNLCGIALLDLFVGYDTAVVIDALQTGRYSRGTIVELSQDDLRAVGNPSPHYTGLAELILMAEELRLQFPRRIAILAVEVGETAVIGGCLSVAVARAVSRVTARIREIISDTTIVDHELEERECTSFV